MYHHSLLHLPPPTTTHLLFHPRRPLLLSPTSPPLLLTITTAATTASPHHRRRSPRRRHLPPPRSSSSSLSLPLDGFDLRRDIEERGGAAAGIAERVASIIPGGSWWRLGDEEEEGAGARRKGVSVIVALRRMWMLVARDRLVILLGFASLVGAAVRRMREMLYGSLLFQDVSFFDEETVGDLTSRLGSDCQQVSRVIGNDLNLISRNVLQGTGALIYLLFLSWPLALSTVLICSALATIMFVYGRYQKRAAKLTQEFTACANEVAQETLSLVRTVRVYGTENHEFRRYFTWLEKLYDINLRQSMAYGCWSLSFNFLYHSTQVIAVLIGGISIMSGRITAEQLTKFILYSEWLILSTWWIGDNWSSLMQSVGASEKVFKLMDLLPSGQFLSEGLKLEKLVGHIEFVNVSFFYPSRSEVPVLQGVSLSVQPNEVVAIVGLSGSGKSTIVNLLLRLYEPTDGQILVDGVPLGELDIKWFRERIGFVGQEPRLFRMDICSNIKYGCPREVSQEEVEWAAKQAFAHEFIVSLPNGYETLVDDALLSGGQKQRIAIARAILRDPTILILDEATSALDAESEHNVKGVIRAVQNGSKTGRTVIVIAHRLSTIQSADKIIVMDSGRVAEVGSHKELVQKDGLYAKLVKRQADAFA